MRVLVLGGGGREKAIAWACRRFGNDVRLQPELGSASLDDTDLVIPGPEALLVAGAADECAARDLPCFGPTADLARLEASKGFARDLANQLGIPGPAYGRFSEVEPAATWSADLDRPVVVKLDGLAAGKGVTVPASPEQSHAAIAAAAAAGEFVLEERLRGPECSLLALCDGHRAVALPIAQDHKRIGEGDTGPNTGGMGAYAPAPVPYPGGELIDTFVQPVLDHLREQGTPYIGVLYAGLMLTADGPRLIEYNVRFGDPEAQAVLPLLDADLAEVAMACTRGSLDPSSVLFRDGAAVSVVAASRGYPSAPVTGIAVIDRGTDSDDAIRFDAAVDPQGNTAGGRVLAVTGVGSSLSEARTIAYRRLSAIDFDGIQIRRDIGWRAPGAVLSSYAEAGVDIDEGSRAVAQMKAAVEATHDNGVLHGVGNFGGVFSAAAITAMDDPVLVASTDGVGTKVELAARLDRVRGIGADIVNHCVNDVLVQAARPLFFLDYIAAGVIDADRVAEVVHGMADACRAAGCALLGGETAEMPGVYRPGAFDVAGTLVGVAERSDLLPRSDVAAGDLLLGLASSGPHTNGYSLLRTAFEWIPMDTVPDGCDRSLADMLLEPHRSYLDALTPALATGKVKALAHVTGGGLPENLPRVLPAGLGARVRLGSWPVPSLFALVRELASTMSTAELYRTLNMGIGMVVICSEADADDVRASFGEASWVIGELTDSSEGVQLC